MKKVTLRLQGDRQAKVPLVQVLALADLLGLFEDPVWHLNDCGCCLSVHERDNHYEGFVVGPDGWADWVSDR